MAKRTAHAHKAPTHTSHAESAVVEEPRKTKEDFKVKSTEWYGYIPDLPDFHDFHLTDDAISRKTATVLPVSTNNRHASFNPPIWDQGQLGSCTGHGTARAFEYMLRKQNLTLDFPPSRLGVYYNARKLEGTTSQDAGAMVRDAIKGTLKFGVSPEKLWPYDIKKFSHAPTPAAVKAALLHETLSYARVPRNLTSFKKLLAAGIPIVIGFSVYDAFESSEVASSGILNLPTADEQQVGGHCVCIMDYDDSINRFVVANSWGTDWGLPHDPGYFTMPYTYVMNADLADDFWVINTVEQNAAMMHHNNV